MSVNVHSSTVENSAKEIAGVLDYAMRELERGQGPHHPGGQLPGHPDLLRRDPPAPRSGGGLCGVQRQPGRHASADAVDGTLANSSLGSWTEEEVQAMIDNEVSVWMFNGETDGDNPAAQQDVIEIVKDLYREAGKSESWIEEHVRASGLQSWKFKDWGETDHSVTKVVAWYYLGQPYMDVEKGTSLKAGDTYQYSGKEESYEKYQYTMDYVYTVYPGERGPVGEGRFRLCVSADRAGPAGRRKEEHYFASSLTLCGASP